MPYVAVGKENSGDIELYYEDHGSGIPVVLIHGYPLSGSSWEKQVPVLLAAGPFVLAGMGYRPDPTVDYSEAMKAVEEVLIPTTNDQPPRQGCDARKGALALQVRR